MNSHLCRLFLEKSQVILLILKKGQSYLRRECKVRRGEITPLGLLAGRGGTAKKVP